MEYDKEKVDEVVLALLYLTSSTDQYATRAWKGLNSEALDRLYAKGLIGDPRLKSPTVEISKEGAALAKELFAKYFEPGD